MGIVTAESAIEMAKDWLPRQRVYFENFLRNTNWRERVKKLRTLKTWLYAHRDELNAALANDLRRSPAETEIVELLPLIAELKFAIRHLDLWMKPEKVRAQLPLWGSKSWVHPEPKGVVLIISPWNYPVQLAVGPMISAIAAGNSMVIKPSEFTPHSSAFLKKLATELFSPDELLVVEGDHTVAAALTHLHYDHIFFTGSPEIGKKVMHAASDNLVPVTLELGGQNPVIVDETANVKDAADKIIWGKLINNGQSCVAPNAVWVHESKKEALLIALKAVINRFLEGDEAHWQKSPNLVRMVNVRHLQRVKSLLDSSLASGGQLIYGGITDESDLYLSPTCVLLTQTDNPILNEEIFGPVLPVIAYRNEEEVVAFIRMNEKPLAVYLFSRSKSKMKRFSSQTSSGTIVWNDTKIQFANPALPFGGIGHSGMGKGHGHFGFREFSNERAYLSQRRGLTTVKLFYPPYSSLKQKLIRFVTRLF
jgi:aldehyde dehydrogenase (NAD+)